VTPGVVEVDDSAPYINDPGFESHSVTVGLRGS
jgi:hypothetical protein